MTTASSSGWSASGRRGAEADEGWAGEVRPLHRREAAGEHPGQPGTESVERREGTEGNTGESRTHRTQSRARVGQGLDRVRHAAQAQKQERFTALLHHVTVDLLKAAYSWRTREAAPGVDGLMWRDSEQDLEANVVDVQARVHRGPYRAPPSRRTYLAKPEGQQRPWGMAALEAKIVQRALVEGLKAIDEEDFCGCSYGFRPGVVSTMGWTRWRSRSPVGR